jgi:hypothetical protein
MVLAEVTLFSYSAGTPSTQSSSETTSSSSLPGASARFLPAAKITNPSEDVIASRAIIGKLSLEEAMLIPVEMNAPIPS